MSWKCPQCGFAANAERVRTCEGCGHVHFGNIVLVSVDTAKQIRMSIDTAVGQGILKTFVGDDAKYASDPQFRLYRDAALACWAITKIPTAKNATFLNGSPLSDSPAPLAEGAVISIGADKMRLNVKFEG
jgi:hypothetical protein